MNLEQKNTKKQGDVGLGVAIGFFASQGHTVCIPLTDSQDYDLIIETTDGLKKIQVKTTRCKNVHGLFQVELRTKGGMRGNIVKHFNVNSVDFIFIITEELSKYLIPTAELICNRVNEKQRNSIILGVQYERFKV